MKWIKGHPRGTLTIGIAGVALAQFAIITGAFGTYTVMALVFVPYAVLAVINGWVLRLKGRSLHWLWFYVLYSWGGALVPVLVALFAKPAQADSHDQVPAPNP
jgi:hypothetical protein